MIRLLASRFERLPVQTRMPFRYGIATLTDLPLAILFLRFEFGKSGPSHWGHASDFLPPRWFKKDPDLDPNREVEEMVDVIRNAVSLAERIRQPTPFEFSLELTRAQKEWAAQQEGIPPLLANFGSSLVERALLDAFCRARETPFPQLLRTNELGIRLEAIHPELAGTQPADGLPAEPLTSVSARHTLGFGDPLTEGEFAPEDRIPDPLPQSLEAAIQTYGLNQFKVKINGDREHDLERLEVLAALLPRLCPDGYQLSLDGNEQFSGWDHFSGFWQEAANRPDLEDLLKHVLFIEQPLARSAALQTHDIGKLSDGSPTPPVIIDESDAGPEIFREALACGYRGTSHKNCKGVFKGLAHRCLIEKINRDTRADLLMSGEDLGNVGPVALLQDLHVQATLGNASVERNGHHYFYGLSMLPKPLQQLVLDHHPELYQPSPEGVPVLQIRSGKIPLGDCASAPFGTRFSPEALYKALKQKPIES